jgi:hypothetical protein
MSKTLRNVGFAALLAISAGILTAGQASALSMAECSTKYAEFKLTNPSGSPGYLKWNDFRKAQCGSDAAATDAAATAPAAPAPAAKTSKAAATKATAAKTAAAPVATTSGSFMKDCSASWKAMQANNSVPAGTTWKDFVAAKCVVASAPAAAPAASASTGNFMKDCSTSWKAMQAAGTVPAGMAWKDFVAAKCVVAGAPAAAATPAVAKKTGGLFTKKADVSPPEPADTADTTPLATTDKNGKPFTEGQMKAHQRIRACGDQYRSLKAANKLPAQIVALDGKHRWPQFWSLCNDQLKAKGQ